MDDERLRTFLAVVELGSFSAAAQRLRTQVSTVSRRMKELEQTVGVELLVRGGRGVRMNAAGERFAERARLVLSELEHAIASARGEAHAGPTHLRISTPLELALSLLPEPLASVTRARPEITWHVHSDVRRVSLVEEDFDAAVRIGPPRVSELIARPIGMVTMVGASHPRCTVRRPADLEQRRFVSPGGVRRAMPARFGTRKVTLGTAADPTVSSFTEAAELACRVELAAVLPSFTAVRYLRDRRLSVLHPKLAIPSVPLHVVLPRRHRSNAALALLGDELEATLRAIEAELRSLL